MKVGLFKEISQQFYDRQITFSADDYIRLLNTFSDNIMLSELKRNKLFKEIRELLENNNESKVERPYRTELSIFQLSG